MSCMAVGADAHQPSFSRPWLWSEWKAGDVIPSVSPQGSCVSSSAQWYVWYLRGGLRLFTADPFGENIAPGSVGQPLVEVVGLTSANIAVQ